MVASGPGRFSMTPVWSLPRSASRFPRLPPWLGFLAFGLLIIVLIVRQLTRPDGYYGTPIPEISPVVDGSTKSLSSWNPTSWTPTSIFGSSASVEHKVNEMLNPDREVKIMITGAVTTHDEVAAPIIAAFGSIPGANITGILLKTIENFGSREMYRNLKVDTPNPVPEAIPYFTSFDHVINNPPDIIVCVTCANDMWDWYKPLLEKTNVHIFCLVHHADRWDNYEFNLYEKQVASWVAADRMDFITLSPHVAKSLVPQLNKWKELRHKVFMPPVHSFTPIFAIDVPEIDSDGPDEISFGMQGKYSSDRRNYTRSFEELGMMKKMLEEADDRDLESSLKLHMVGSGERPHVPEDVVDMVVFDARLNFTDFYTVISKINAMVPAFADDDYYVYKASSSIPAALIAGSPLVATQRLLDTYSYLEEDAVWFQGENQTDVEIMWEIAQKPRWEREQKMRHARMLGAKLVEQAKASAAEWVNDVLRRRQGREEWLGRVPAS